MKVVCVLRGGWGNAKAMESWVECFCILEEVLGMVCILREGLGKPGISREREAIQEVKIELSERRERPGRAQEGWVAEVRS